MQLGVGRIAHITVEDRGQLGCRPAIMVWPHGAESTPGVSGFNGVMFLDGSNDAALGGNGDRLVEWVTSVVCGDGPGEYHDPLECPRKP